MSTPLEQAIAASADHIAAQAAGRRPSLAVLLGSGWAPLAERLQDAVAIPYAQLPAFPHLDVEGHKGTLLLGRLGGREVAVLCGRKHFYETGDAAAMKGAIRSLAADAFAFEERGITEFKGIGAARTYFLIGVRAKD